MGWDRGGAEPPARRDTGGYLERLGIFFLALTIGLSVAGVLWNTAARPMPEADLATGPMRFDGARALSLTTEFVTRFPVRADGEPGRISSAQWIVDQLVALGYDPQLQTFRAWIAGTYHLNLANLVAVKPGRTSDAIAVYAHYDIPPFVLEGAADNGSGVGALLELARVLAGVETEKTIVFLFLDASEYGKAGVRAFLGSRAKMYPGPIVAGVGLDFLNMGEMAGISVEATGTRRGYTPPWLRSLAHRSADRSGDVYRIDTISEWAERSFPFAPTDTGIFLWRGVPAVNLAGVPVDRAAERALYHTAGDTAANLEAAAFQKWGAAAELLIRSLDASPAFPRGSDGSMFHLGLPDDRYLPGWAVAAVQFLAFAPLWALTGVYWWRRRRTLRAAAAINLAEFRRVLVAAACLALGLAGPRLLVLAGVLARYDMYPATPKDLFLFRPQVLPVLAALLLAGGAVFLIRRYTGWLDPPLATDWRERHHSLTSILALVVFLAWLAGDGWAAVTFLALPAFLWLLMPEPVEPGALAKRVANGAAVVAGTAMFIAFLVIFRQVYIIGPTWWYLLLGATYGLFTLGTLAAFLIVAALHWEAFVLGTGVGARHVLPSDFEWARWTGNRPGRRTGRWFGK